MRDRDELAGWSQEVIAKGSQSFAAASRLLPREVRQDTVMLYAWCRHADDVIDGQDHGAPASQRPDMAAALKELRAQTQEALRSDAPTSPPFEALREVARRHDFPETWPMTLIEGFAMDTAGRRIETLSDTLDYAYHVAGIVGVMMARIMGAEDERALDRACDLGIALQLTNIARDVHADAQIDRVYMPAEWLRGANIHEAPPSPELYEQIRRLIEAAEPYYASGLAGLSYLPLREAWAIAAARRIYREIGRKILCEGPAIYGARIRTTGPQKSRLILAAFRDALASRRGEPPPRPPGLWTRPR